MTIIAQDHVRVYQSGRNTWGWCKQVNGCGRHATELFASEIEAAKAAANIAQCAGLPLRVSDTMQRLLTATWYTEGWQKAAAGKPRDMCRNQHERRGWDEAQAHSYMLAQVGTGALVEVEVAA